MQLARFIVANRYGRLDSLLLARAHSFQLVAQSLNGVLQLANLIAARAHRSLNRALSRSLHFFELSAQRADCVLQVADFSLRLIDLVGLGLGLATLSNRDDVFHARSVSRKSSPP